MAEQTFTFEQELPRVPLPALNVSAAQLREWCAPLLTATELAETDAALAQLLAPDSPAWLLQAELERYDTAPGVVSWLDTFWPARYLGRRDRIALNANFFFLFGEDKRDQVQRAAALVEAAASYKLALDDSLIPPARLRGQPLSMAQQRFLFSATRIPGEQQDTVRAPFPSPARHIVVLFRGNMFRLDVIGDDGPYDRAGLALALRQIQESAPAAAVPVGSFTTLARAEWAAVRNDLLAANASAFDTVETALLCLCLDEVAPADDTGACDVLLAGDSANRWFDKAVSLIVTADGQAGINVEHCGLDGTTVLDFVDSILTGPDPTATTAGTPEWAPVQWTLDRGQEASAAAAQLDFAAYASATATATVSFDFGTSRAKALGVSPDALAQLAYQLAHKRAKGFTGATYESISTRQFRHGRTEAMRVVTPQVVDFVAVMDDPESDQQARKAAFTAAAAAHVARAKQCRAGNAPEQHLWELLLIQQRKGTELGAAGPLALYGSPGWTILREDYLSTSSAPSDHIKYFGFGSTSPRCIGVAYVLLPDRWNIYLSTPRPQAAGMAAFADALRQAVAQLLELCGG